MIIYLHCMRASKHLSHNIDDTKKGFKGFNFVVKQKVLTHLIYTKLFKLFIQTKRLLHLFNKFVKIGISDAKPIFPMVSLSVTSLSKIPSYFLYSVIFYGFNLFGRRQDEATMRGSPLPEDHRKFRGSAPPDRIRHPST